MKLLVDIGNSRIKWAMLSANKLSESYAKAHKNNAIAICKPLFQQENFTHIILVHVLGKSFESEIIALANQSSLKLLTVHSELQAYGIKTAYLQPDKLGADRFVAMVAAHQLSSQSHFKQYCIVIDCGTAITIDVIDPKGEHLGGVISPGLHLCEDGLINRAKNLLEIKQELKQSTLSVFAKTTAQGVKSGCHYSLTATIDKVCKEMEQTIKSPYATKKIICGGDAKAIHALLDKSYELNENLLMQGLQFIANEE